MEREKSRMEKNRSKKLSSERIWMIAAVVILTGVFLLLGIQKDIWFCDEVYSYTSANAQSFHNPIFRESNVWITGADVTRYLGADDRSLNFGEISRYLFADHVPLYFWLFRIASIAAVGSCSKWVGLSINIIFYFVLFFCLRRLFDRKIVGRGIEQKEKSLTIVLSMVCLLHPTVLSEALTIRMYLMFTLAQVMMLLAVKENDFSGKSYVKLGLAALFGILTHFYFWIWLAFFSAFYVISILAEKGHDHRMKKAVGYAAVMLLSLGAATVLFPNWFINIFANTSSKGHSSVQKIFAGGDLGAETGQAVRTIISHLTAGNNLVIPVMVFSAAAVIYIIQKKQEAVVWLSVLSSAAYSVFVIHTQPSVEGRYLWSSAILILIAFLMMLRDDLEFLISKIPISKIDVPSAVAGIMASFMLVNLILSFRNDCKNIQYLKARTADEYQAVKREHDNPWIVFHDNTDWVFLCSMYDFTIPALVKRVNLDESGQYDEIIQNASELIIYTTDNKKSVEDCVKYIEQSCDKKAGGFEKISKSFAMSVYKINLEVR